MVDQGRFCLWKETIGILLSQRPRGPLILHEVPKGFNFFRMLFLSGRDSGVVS